MVDNLAEKVEECPLNRGRYVLQLGAEYQLFRVSNELESVTVKIVCLLYHGYVMQGRSQEVPRKLPPPTTQKYYVNTTM